MKNKYKYLSAKWQLLKLKRKIKEIQLNEKLLWNNLVDLKTKKFHQDTYDLNEIRQLLEKNSIQEKT